MAQLSKVQGAVALILAEARCTGLYITPTQLRVFAGVQGQKGKIKDLCFPNDQRTDDEIDAMILAVVGLVYRGRVVVDAERLRLVRRLKPWKSLI